MMKMARPPVDTLCLALAQSSSIALSGKELLLKMSISSYPTAGPSISGDELEFCLVALRDLSDQITPLVFSAQIFPQAY